MHILDLIPRFSTFLGAAGLIGLGLYQLSIGDLTSAFQSFMAGLAAFGVGHQMAETNLAVNQVKTLAMLPPSVTIQDGSGATQKS